MRLLAAIALSLLCAGAVAVPIEEPKEVVDIELIHISVIIPEKKQDQPGQFIICSVTFSAKGGGVLTTKYHKDLPKDPNYLLQLIDTAIWVGDAVYMTVDVAPACGEGERQT